MVHTYTYKDIEEVLMDPNATPGVNESYFVIESESGENITVINPGKNGSEYNKTYGHFHTFPGVESYKCLFGQGVLVLQRNGEEGMAKEVSIIALRPGIVVEVPSGFGHTLVNTGKSFLVVLDNSSQTKKYQNVNHLKENRGFSYYIVEKKGEVSFERNPSYSYHPQISL